MRRAPRLPAAPCHDRLPAMESKPSGTAPPRSVRSYVRRRGRMTPAQRRALARHLPVYGLPAERPCDLSRAFGREAPRSAEIGFGMGDSLLRMAAASPDRDFLGVEVHEPGIGRLLHRMVELGLTNLRVIRGDAVPVLRTCLPERSLHLVCLFFPDPWPKKRHHKRRLVDPAFVRLVASRLVPGGRFLLATDWPPYAEHMLEVLEAEPGLANLAGPGRFAPRAPERGITRFERRAAALGHPVFDLAFSRVP